MTIPLRIQPLLLALCACGVAKADGLNDTGVDYCRDPATGGVVACSGDPAVVGQQDGRFGRDAAYLQGQLSRTGGGGPGFDFTKVANNGSTLAAGAVLGSAAGDWACTYDNNTGLLWEVKTTSGLRSQDNTYSWYDSGHSYAGQTSQAGTQNGGSCFAAGRCDTEKFVADVNNSNLCAHSNWRMPTVSELANLVDHGRAGPAINPSFFPNTLSAAFWTSLPSAYPFPGFLVWSVGFTGGSGVHQPTSTQLSVRLVRTGH